MLTPARACTEAGSVSSSFAAGGQHPTKNDVMRVASWAKRTLTGDPRLRLWYGPESNDALLALKDFNRAGQTTHGSKLRGRAGTDLVPKLQALGRELDNPENGHQPRLLRSVIAEMRSGSPDFARLDRDLRALAAEVVNAGRDGPTVVRDLAHKLVSVNHGQADGVLRETITGSVGVYEVAVGLVGVKHFVRSLPAGVVPKREGQTWESTASEPARKMLAKFIDRSLQQSTAVLCVRVCARDSGQAHRLAVTTVDEIRAQLIAGHRASFFSVAPTALVLTPSGSVVRRPAPVVVAIERGRLLPASAATALRQELHQVALARSEGTALRAIIDIAIAIEHLSREAARPHGGASIHRADFAPPHIGACAALTSAFHTIAGTHTLLYEAARRSPKRAVFLDLNSWLGGAGNPYQVDLVRFQRLLVAQPGQRPPTLDASDTPESARAVLDEVLSALSPFAATRVAQAADLWRDPMLLVQTATAEARHAYAHCDRVRLIRNRAVHDALTTASGDTQLAVNASHLMDAVFEVLPRWLNPPTPTWRALRKVIAYQRQLWRDWQGGHQPDPRYIRERTPQSP